MGFLSVLSCAQQWISFRLQPGDLAIDATVGTGADTLFLAQKVGKRGQVIGFDIQSEALTLAQARIRKQEDSTQLGSISLLQLSHDRMAEAVPDTWQGNVGAVMFNLGYLPSEGADSTIITKTDSTLPHSSPPWNCSVRGALLPLCCIQVMMEDQRKQMR